MCVVAMTATVGLSCVVGGDVVGACSSNDSYSGSFMCCRMRRCGCV